MLVQHEKNEFNKENDEDGDKVCQEMIKTEVMDVVTQISQNQIQNIEKTFESIDGIFETLKQNMSSE